MNIFRTQRHHLHGAGGQVDLGHGGVHHVGGRVVQTIIYTGSKRIFKVKSKGSILGLSGMHHQYALHNV